MNRKGDIYGYEKHHDPYRPASARDEALLDGTYEAVEALDDSALQAEFDSLPTSPRRPSSREEMVDEVVTARCVADYLSRRKSNR